MQYELLKSKIERPYNVEDISIILKREIDKSECYTIEFQQWFIDNLVRCTNHNYPYLWHKSIHGNCPKCKEGVMPDEERYVKFYNKDGEYVALSRLTQFSYDDYMKNGKYTKPVEYEILVDVRGIMKAQF